ncbi:ABC transporter permease [Bacillus cereus group sp. TH43LC]|uniref:FtsX-like permease family protein n=1 Tax=Bacillus TaxID=1386 RepID=UPI0011A3CA5F|nr:MULTISPECIES: ABC transporter permease [Bacillus cereus group]MBE7143385.1 ABC transporter permease [Bacillus paranthracis]MDA1502477.1 ABC transporter permease [Bacillus cereus group sp. TH43LC]MDA1789709.1 ABC transporter permease [Bacillus cereus group sp. BY5-1LC]MDA1864088.1 ABC transporter permease [Bacillus cereus group sp. BY128LC]MEC3528248.1 ABC transporter permease [Bacillus paranthracis]
MLFKLSMSGLKSKLKDYIVLLVGLVMSISIFYMFQTLALNKAFIESNSVIQSIGFVFQAGSFLLAIITFFYILYANSFLLSLRQKEFGMYMMLGAKKHKVTLLMFIETIVLGAASLAIGITVGVGLAEGIGQLLMKQLEFAGEGYKAFYLPSMTVTCIFFLALFVLSAIMNSIKLSRISVLQLVHADAQTERVAVKGKMTGLVAFLAVILLGIGYASMIYMEKLREMGILIALVTTTAGTYMLFGSLLPVIIKKLKSNKKRSEKGLNAFTFAQLNFRINSLTKVLATVAMLVALGAGAISGGMAFKNNVIKMVDGFVIYDSVVHNPTAEEKKILDDITFKEKSEYRYKVDDKYVYYVKEDLEKNRPLVKDMSNIKSMKDIVNTKKVSEELPVGAVSREMNEKDASAKELPQEWDEAFRTIEPFYVHEDHAIKIVDQKMYDTVNGKEGIVFTGKTDDFEAHKKEWKKLDELQLDKYKNVKAERLDSKYQAYDMFYGVASGTVFMGFFLGIAFLAMMASCLMFKILSGASKDITRYQMLRKIGVRRELLTKSIYKELFLVFLFPAIVGIAHVLVGMNIFGFILIDPYFRIWVPIIIFVVIYTIYYFITVQLYKGIVLPKED